MPKEPLMEVLKPWDVVNVVWKLRFPGVLGDGKLPSGRDVDESVGLLRIQELRIRQIVWINRQPR